MPASAVRKARRGNFTANGSRGRAGYQASAPLEGEIGPDPLDQDTHPVAKADQEKDMHRTPEQPGQQAADAKPAEIGDGAAAPDGREIADIDIMEWFRRRPAFELSTDRPGRVDALLFGSGRYAWHRFSVFTHHQRRIANDEDLGMARQSEIGADLDPADAIGVGVKPFRRG